jgi:hypothetical protein
MSDIKTPSSTVDLGLVVSRLISEKNEEHDKIAEFMLNNYFRKILSLAKSLAMVSHNRALFLLELIINENTLGVDIKFFINKLKEMHIKLAGYNKSQKSVENTLNAIENYVAANKIIDDLKIDDSKTHSFSYYIDKIQLMFHKYQELYNLVISLPIYWEYFYECNNDINKMIYREKELTSPPCFIISQKFIDKYNVEQFKVFNCDRYFEE